MDGIRCEPRFRFVQYGTRRRRIQWRNGIVRYCLVLLVALTGMTAAGGGGTSYDFFDHQRGVFNGRRATLCASGLVAVMGGFYLYTRPIYYDEPSVSFHLSRRADGRIGWFENKHRGQDKFGHVYSTSLFTQNIYAMARWSGMDNRSASWSAALGGIAILMGMEVHDAYYEKWGFSMGDAVANVIGGVWPVAQQNYAPLRYWDYKMSYDFNGGVSEDGAIESYGNMTFWLSGNPRGVMGPRSPAWLPGWLNLAAGVGVTDRDYGPREWYLGLDLNLKSLPVAHPFGRHVLALLDRFRLPLPAVRVYPDVTWYLAFW